VGGQTPWQTTGPFFHFGLAWRGCADLTGESDLGARPDLSAPGHDVLVKHVGTSRDRASGTRIELVGQVWDNTGAPLTDSLIEIWQASASGRYSHPEDRRTEFARDPNFIGYGRCASDKGGAFRFRTVKPGRVPGPGNTLQAPHIALGMIGPGILKRLVTRVYFADALENAEDPILALVPDERRATLMATPEAANVYRFDIRLSGPQETVFFEF
jgi:protocatechuate 3,4-dioxygenase alpha subunit